MNFKCLLLFFLSFNLGFLFGGTNKKGKAYEYFLMGEYESLNNNFIQAERYYLDALSIFPDSHTILNTLINLKSYQGEYREVIKYLKHLTKLEPNNKVYGLQLYSFLKEIGNTIHSEMTLDSLLYYHPNDYEILLMYANLQFENQNWSDLLNTYKKIYLLDSSNYDFIYRIYDIGITTNNVDILRKILLELKLLSNDFKIIELLIELEASIGNYRKAISYIGELSIIQGFSDENRIKICELYLEVKGYNQVIEILYPVFKSGDYSLKVLKMLLYSFTKIEATDKEIEISNALKDEYPDLSLGYESLALIHIKLDSIDQAMGILLNAISKFPNDVIFPYLIAIILYEESDYVKAKKYCSLALNIDSDFILAQQTMALIYENLNDIHSSDSLFKHIINQNKNDAISQNDYAYIISQRGNLSNEDLNFALELAENAIQIEPDNAAFLDTIGWVHYQLGAYEKAREYLEKSLSLNNNNPVILEHLGDIYMKLNQKSDALNIYNKVLSLDYDNQVVRNKIILINGK